MDIKQIKENKLKIILAFSIPSIIAMMLQTVITITDGYFTGNYVGENALAAIMRIFNPMNWRLNGLSWRFIGSVDLMIVSR